MKIIQITDTHLFADDESEIFGVKSNFKFREVINKIIDEEHHDANMIFLTGDISQDETIKSYQIAVAHLSKLNLPVYWIPGNHDNIKKAEEIFQNANNFNRKINLSLPNWHFIFLNTKIDGSEAGYLSDPELTLLSNELAASPADKKIAIVMHHHPAPVGTPLVDHYILMNADEFWSVVSGKKVELIICGHVHGDYRFIHNDVVIESAPATCLQWEKGTKKLTADKKIGYKIYHFDNDGYRSSVKMW